MRACAPPPPVVSVAYMIIGCMNVYQDADLLAVTLPALAAHVDRIVMVDGAYLDFPAYSPGGLSTDGTHELAKSFGVDMISAPGLNEIEKRSRYFVGGFGDWYLVVDADEVIEGVDANAIRSLLSDVTGPCDYWVAFCDGRAPWEDKHRRVFRLHRHRDGIRYYGTHHAVHIGTQLVLDQRAPTFPGLRFRHLAHLRSPDRLNRRAEYYAKLRVSEAKFRAGKEL